MSDAIRGRRARRLGVCHAKATRGHQACLREGHPYYAINLVDADAQGQLFEVCFGDETWMLAREVDLEPTHPESLPAGRPPTTTNASGCVR